MSAHDQNVKENRNHFDKRVPLMLELGFREDGVESLWAYIDLLWKSNEELNLISRKMLFADLIDNHVIDCLLPLKQFPVVQSAGDFGSGGGLPGVIYAIQFPKTAYQLFEKSVLKREFLKRCVAIAPNLKIQGEIPQDLGKVEMISARAFKPVNVILDVSRNYFRSGGKYFLLKGRRETIEEEIALAKKQYKELKTETIALKSPLLEVERHLVLIG